MHWLIKCRSKPNTDDLRLATIDAHRRFLDGYPQVTWFSGPIFSDDNKNAIGSLRLIEFPGRSAAQAYIHADPYTKAGIFEAITIERWEPRVHVRWRDDITTPQRIEREQQYSLRRGELLEETIWRYELHDRSAANVRALIDDDAVRDTAYIDRPTLTVPSREIEVSLRRLVACDEHFRKRERPVQEPVAAGKRLRMFEKRPRDSIRNGATVAQNSIDEGREGAAVGWWSRLPEPSRTPEIEHLPPTPEHAAGICKRCQRLLLGADDLGGIVRVACQLHPDEGAVAQRGDELRRIEQRQRRLPARSTDTPARLPSHIVRRSANQTVAGDEVMIEE